MELASRLGRHLVAFSSLVLFGHFSVDFAWIIFPMSNKCSLAG